MLLKSKPKTFVISGVWIHAKILTTIFRFWMKIKQNKCLNPFHGQLLTKMYSVVIEKRNGNCNGIHIDNIEFKNGTDTAKCPTLVNIKLTTNPQQHKHEYNALEAAVKKRINCWINKNQPQKETRQKIQLQHQSFTTCRTNSLMFTFPWVSSWPARSWSASSSVKRSPEWKLFTDRLRKTIDNPKKLNETDTSSQSRKAVQFLHEWFECIFKKP